jgi:excisionase family DNA binding protein
VVTTIQDQLLPITAGAKKIGVGRSTFYELIADGSIKTVRVRGRRLVAESEIQRFIAQLIEAGA